MRRHDFTAHPVAVVVVLSVVATVVGYLAGLH